mmetsp:Transcript_5297/g.10862  ORF Transcript_5297/g.10862 Transcript_5297/m.10862 type:complete len:397 (-) Transcript_5297:40-1230(-)
MREFKWKLPEILSGVGEICGMAFVSTWVSGTAVLGQSSLKSRLCVSRYPVHHGPRARPSPPQAMFDFIQKGIQYAKDRAQRDIEQVRKFNDGLVKSREKLARDLEAVLTGVDPEQIEDVLEDLEEVLITSDLGVGTVEVIIDDLRSKIRSEKIKEGGDIRRALKESLVEIIEKSQGGDEGSRLKLRDDGTPTIIMIIGANGMGKTTTIGKLASRFQAELGKKVLVAAGDTFRAAAVEQLETWAERASVDIVKPGDGQKSASAVVFSATKRAFEENYDVLIIDTSGRLHTNANLMEELKKMKQVVEKWRASGPDETLLVVDASIGRNATVQARTWDKEIGLTGLIVTKLDGTARAGFVVSVVDELRVPVKLVGVGEKIDDLRDFEAKFFVDGLVGQD